MAEKKDPIRTLKPFYKHQWIDILDPEDAWLPGQIIDLDWTPDFTKLRGVKVHYYGFAKQYDETIPVNSTRVAPIYTKTTRPAGGVPASEIQVNAQFDIAVGRLYRICQIKEIEVKEGRDRMIYVEYGENIKEWVDVDTPRLHPLHTYTIKTLKLRKNETGKKSTESQEDKWRTELKEKKGWILEVQAGDGACLFRSVAHQVYGDPKLHPLIRQKVCEYMESERTFFSSFAPDFDSYLMDLKKPAAWGDHLEIQAMSEIYDRPIVVYAFGLEPLATYQGAPTHNAPIRLSYHYSSHYNSIIDPKLHESQLLTTKPGEIEDIQIKESKKRGGRRTENFVIHDHVKKHMSDLDEAIFRSLNPDTSLDSVMGTPSLSDLKAQFEGSDTYYVSPDNSSHPSYTPQLPKPSNHSKHDKDGKDSTSGSSGSSVQGGTPFEKMDDIEKAIHLSLEEQKKLNKGNLVEWTCSACTYINPKTVQDRCTVCQTPKPTTPTKTTTTTSTDSLPTTTPTVTAESKASEPSSSSSSDSSSSPSSSGSSSSSSESGSSSSSSESSSVSGSASSSSSESSTSSVAGTNSNSSSESSVNPVSLSSSSDSSSTSSLPVSNNLPIMDDKTNAPPTTKKSESSSSTTSETTKPLPGPMKHCHEMLGFSLHKCEVAYNIALADLSQTTNEPADEVVIQNMTTLLLQS